MNGRKNPVHSPGDDKHGNTHGTGGVKSYPSSFYLSTAAQTVRSLSHLVTHTISGISFCNTPYPVYHTAPYNTQYVFPCDKLPRISVI